MCNQNVSRQIELFCYIKQMDEYPVTVYNILFFDTMWSNKLNEAYDIYYLISDT